MPARGDDGPGPVNATVASLVHHLSNFSDNEILGLDKREQQEAVQGVWIYEVAELEGLSKSEVTKVKLFICKTVDSGRPKIDRPRRCTLVPTPTQHTFL